MSKIAIIGYGYVGRAYHKPFPDALIYDRFQPQVSDSKEEVNKADLAIVAVPTDLNDDGSLDMSIVEDVVSWLETPLILIKSALMPGTVDRLVKETGKKIAVSVEMVGEGKYFIPYWKYPHPTDPTYHQFLIVGGEKETASRCADFLWEKLSPSIDIHIVSAVEAEITKMMENTWGALKVSFANQMYDICEAYGADYKTVLQAWGADGRTEKMHMRVTPGKRGWKSKCYDKDIPGLAHAARLKGVNTELIEGLQRANKEHLTKN